jgi:hypothetical protein
LVSRHHYHCQAADALQSPAAAAMPHAVLPLSSLLLTLLAAAAAVAELAAPGHCCLRMPLTCLQHQLLLVKV